MTTLSLNEYSVLELSNDESMLIIGGGFWHTLGLIFGAVAAVGLVALLIILL